MGALRIQKVKMVHWVSYVNLPFRQNTFREEEGGGADSVGNV